MKLFTTVAVFLLLLSTATAQIEFEHGTWAEVKAKAAEQNKPIFLDAYASWCGPCKKMAANIFPQKEAGDYYNENYICYKMDMEKGEGPALAKVLGVKAFPTLYYFNSKGELTHKSVGASSTVARLIENGKDGRNPEKQVFTLKKRFESGEREAEFVFYYAQALTGAYEDASEVVEIYLQDMPAEKMSEEQNWKFITETMTDFDSPTFKRILESKSVFIKKQGVESWNKWISYIMNNVIFNGMRSKMADDKMAEQIKAILGEDAAGQYIAQFQYMKNFRNQEKRHEFASAYFDNYDAGWNDLNSAAWTYFETEEDTKKLKAAAGWAKKSIEMEKNYYNTDTYAALLFKLKKYKKAIEAANVAISVGKELKEDVSGTEDLLKKIKAAKK